MATASPASSGRREQIQTRPRSASALRSGSNGPPPVRLRICSLTRWRMEGPPAAESSSVNRADQAASGWAGGVCVIWASARQAARARSSRSPSSASATCREAATSSSIVSGGEAACFGGATWAIHSTACSRTPSAPIAATSGSDCFSHFRVGVAALPDWAWTSSRRQAARSGSGIPESEALTASAHGSPVVSSRSAGPSPSRASSLRPRLPLVLTRGGRPQGARQPVDGAARGVAHPEFADETLGHLRHSGHAEEAIGIHEPSCMAKDGHDVWFGEREIAPEEVADQLPEGGHPRVVAHPALAESGHVLEGSDDDRDLLAGSRLEDRLAGRELIGPADRVPGPVGGRFRHQRRQCGVRRGGRGPELPPEDAERHAVNPRRAGRA